MTPWPEARIAQVIEMHARGIRNADIAKALGVTRNAVSGIVSRHIRYMPRPRRSIGIERESVTGCRWIYGEIGKGEWHYCGKPTPSGKSWCDEHQARAIKK
jgi:hypothetical protein